MIGKVGHHYLGTSLGQRKKRRPSPDPVLDFLDYRYRV